MLQNRLFFALASRSGFGPAISDPVARSSIVFCNSVFADRIVMAASRLHVSLEQLDVWGVKCGVWSLSVECEERSVKWEVWSVRFGVWRKQWEVWSVDCEVWSVSEVWSVKCEVRSVKFGVWSLEWEGSSEKWEVWSVDCEVWSVKCEVRSVDCEVWSVKCEVRSVKLGVWRKQWEVRSAKWEVWSVKCEVWSVKEAVRSEKCEMWSVKCEVRSEKCGLWSVKCGLWSVKCGLWSAKCEVWTVKCAVWSVKCEVWSVKEAVRSEKCGVWSLKFGVRRVQCAVWGVECRGKDTVGTGCLWTIGHLCLGNFRRRLARVYVIYNMWHNIYIYIYIYIDLYLLIWKYVTTYDNVMYWDLIYSIMPHTHTHTNKNGTTSSSFKISVVTVVWRSKSMWWTRVRVPQWLPSACARALFRSATKAGAAVICIAASLPTGETNEPIAGDILNARRGQQHAPDEAWRFLGCRENQNMVLSENHVYHQICISINMMINFNHEIWVHALFFSRTDTIGMTHWHIGSTALSIMTAANPWELSRTKAKNSAAARSSSSSWIVLSGALWFLCISTWDGIATYWATCIYCNLEFLDHSTDHSTDHSESSLRLLVSCHKHLPKSP